MKVTKLEDKLDMGIRYRIDDLTIEQLVLIHGAIEKRLEDERLSCETLKDLDSYDKYFKKSIDKNIYNCNKMLEAIENKKVLQVDCYRQDVEDIEFEKIIKKYKKVNK